MCLPFPQIIFTRGTSYAQVGLQQGFLLKSVATQLLKRSKPKLGPYLGVEPEDYDKYCAALIQELEQNHGTVCWKVLTARK